SRARASVCGRGAKASRSTPFGITSTRATPGNAWRISSLLPITAPARLAARAARGAGAPRRGARGAAEPPAAGGDASVAIGAAEQVVAAEGDDQRAAAHAPRRRAREPVVRVHEVGADAARDSGQLPQRARI